MEKLDWIRDRQGEWQAGWRDHSTGSAVRQKRCRAVSWAEGTCEDLREARAKHKQLVRSQRGHVGDSRDDSRRRSVDDHDETEEQSFKDCSIAAGVITPEEVLPNNVFATRGKLHASASHGLAGSLWATTWA